MRLFALKLIDRYIIVATDNYQVIKAYRLSNQCIKISLRNFNIAGFRNPEAVDIAVARLTDLVKAELLTKSDVVLQQAKKRKLDLSNQSASQTYVMKHIKYK